MQHHAQGLGERRLRLVVQHQGLAGQDLAPGVLHPLPVDGDQALGDQPLRLSPRADPTLGQPLVHPLGFGVVIGSGPGHAVP